MRKPQFVIISGPVNGVEPLRRTIQVCAPYASSIQVLDVGTAGDVDSLASAASDTQVRKLIDFHDNWPRAYAAAQSRVPMDDWFVLLHAFDRPTQVFLDGLDANISDLEDSSIAVASFPTLSHVPVDGKMVRLIDFGLGPKDYPANQWPDDVMIQPPSRRGFRPTLFKRQPNVLITHSPTAYCQCVIDRATKLPIAGVVFPQFINRVASPQEDALEIIARSWSTHPMHARVRASYPHFADFLTVLRRESVPKYVIDQWLAEKVISDVVAHACLLFAGPPTPMKFAPMQLCTFECCTYPR